MDPSHIVSVCFRYGLLWLIWNNNRQWIIIVEFLLVKGPVYASYSMRLTKSMFLSKNVDNYQFFENEFRFYLMCVQGTYQTGQCLLSMIISPKCQCLWRNVEIV